MSVLVLGSINMDLVAQVARIPAPAETLTGQGFFSAPGGKGANQAVAAAKLGASTAMIGRVGNDLFGTELLDGLREAGVETTAVSQSTTTSSGVALIAVDEDAQNSIIVVPSANGEVGDAELEQLERLLPQTAVLLLQLEIPLEVVETAVSLAQQHAVTVILDPAPAQELPQSLYPQLDIITPNEIEAAQLVGFEVKNETDATRAAEQFVAWGVDHAVVKLGAQGVVAVSAEGERVFVPAFEITAVDTTAAGDAFNGGLAAALAANKPFVEALRWGAAAGALATTKQGAQSAVPTLPELRHLLQRQ